MTQLPESELNSLEKALFRNHGFKADLSHLAIFGLCQKCR
jgi:Fe2+ or Zn2+ uptake regulation protein